MERKSKGNLLHPLKLRQEKLYVGASQDPIKSDTSTRTTFPHHPAGIPRFFDPGLSSHPTPLHTTYTNSRHTTVALSFFQ